MIELQKALAALQIRARSLATPDDPMLHMQVDHLKKMAELQFQMDLMVEQKEVGIVLFCSMHV